MLVTGFFPEQKYSRLTLEIDELEGSGLVTTPLSDIKQEAEMTNDKIKADGKITVELDMSKFLTATVGWSEDDEYPETLGGEIVNEAARLLAIRMETEIKKRIQPVIDAKVEELLTGLLTEEYQPTDSYGSKKGETTSLKAEIAKTAEKALTSGMKLGDGYNSNGSLRKYIDSEIDKQIKGDLKKSLDEVKVAVVERVKQNAAAVIADTITRSAVR